MVEWKNVFYITNLNDGTCGYRSAKETPSYQLCLKPNAEVGISRHYCIYFSDDIKAIMRCISTYVSIYRNTDNFYRNALERSNGCAKLGRVSLEQADIYWKKYKNTKYTKYGIKLIPKAIENGKKKYISRVDKLIYNVKVVYDLENDEFVKIDGKRSDFFKKLYYSIKNFTGNTKKELYHRISNLVDVHCLNEIFHSLKENGIYSIKQLKMIDNITLLDILTSLINEWLFDDEHSFYEAQSD